MGSSDIFTTFDDIIENIVSNDDVEKCLSLYPQYKEELRPLIDIALTTKAARSQRPDENSKIRAHNRVMAALDGLEQKSTKKPDTLLMRFGMGQRFQRLVVTSLVVFTILFSSGTGLVQASSSSLPGDNLYAVKRSWEDVRLALVVDPNSKSVLQRSFDEERLTEIHELYNEHRLEQVNFFGVIQNIDGDIWMVSDIKVKVELEHFGQHNFAVGDYISIIGKTDDGMIEAVDIKYVPGLQTSEQEIISSPTQQFQNTPATMAPTLEPKDLEKNQPDNQDNNNEIDPENKDDQHNSDGQSDNNSDEAGSVETQDDGSDASQHEDHNDQSSSQPKIESSDLENHDNDGHRDEETRDRNCDPSGDLQTNEQPNTGLEEHSQPVISEVGY